MLSRYEVVVDPSVLVAIELHEREAVELGIDDVAHETAEPWRAQLLVDDFVGDSVSLERYMSAVDGIAPALYNGGEMSVNHNVVVEVKETSTTVEIYVVSRIDGVDERRDVDSEAFRSRKNDGVRLSLSRHWSETSDGNSVVFLRAIS